MVIQFCAECAEIRRAVFTMEFMHARVVRYKVYVSWTNKISVVSTNKYISEVLKFSDRYLDVSRLDEGTSINHLF